jgi:DNA-binding CsgD family transcriptional regulator
MVAWERGDYASARALHEESLRLHRQTVDKPGIAFSLNHVGLVALYEGDYASAKALHEESLTLQRELGDAGGRAASLHNLGLVAMYRGDYESAKTLIEESLSLFSELEDRWAISILLNNLGLTALHQGDDEQAARFQEESLALRKELNDRGGIAECLEGLAGVAGAQGKAPRAVRLWAAAEAVREGIGAPLPPGHRPLYETYLTAARNQMGDASWEAAWAEGKMMTLERAVEYALESEWPSPSAASSREIASSGKPPHGLTRREKEISALLARGLTTNRQIASELVISERTIETHVRNTLKKLGLESRAQLAVWAAVQRLGSE